MRFQLLPWLPLWQFEFLSLPRICLLPILESVFGILCPTSPGWDAKCGIYKLLGDVSHMTLQVFYFYNLLCFFSCLVISGKVICSPEALCKIPFSLHEGYEQLLRAELGSLRKGILVVSKSWALDLGLQEKQEVILDALHISQGSLLTLHSFVRGDEDLEDNRTLLSKLSAQLKGYYKQTALTLKQTLVNHGGYTEKIGIIVKITYLGHKAICLYDSSLKIHYPVNYYLTTKTVRDLEKALAELLGSRESFYSLPS